MRLVAALISALLVSVGGASAGGIQGPVSLVVGSGSVWVGFGSGRVVRVDPETRRVSQVVPSSITGFVGSLTSGFGSIWAARHDGSVLRLDGTTGRLLETIFLNAASLAVGEGSVWAANSESALRRIDPRTNRVTGAARVPGRLWGRVTAGPAGVWVQSVPGGRVMGPKGKRILWRVNSRTLALTRTARRRCDTELAVTRTVWALDTCEGTVGQLGERPLDVAKTASAIAVGAGGVWVADGAVVHRVDPVARKVIARIPAQGHALEIGAGAVWVLSMGNGITGWLRRIDPKTNDLVGRPIRLSARQ